MIFDEYTYLIQFLTILYIKTISSRRKHIEKLNPGRHGHGFLTTNSGLERLNVRFIQEFIIILMDFRCAL